MVKFSKGLLEKNLCSLTAAGYDDLVFRIVNFSGHAPVEVAITPSGFINARLRGWGDPWIHDPVNPEGTAKEEILDVLKQTYSNLLLMGLGCGLELKALVESNKIQNKIFVYERYGDFIKTTLSIMDLSREILSGKIIFLLGTDLATYDWEREDLPYLLLHPVLGKIYLEEIKWWKKSFWKGDHLKGAVIIQRLMDRDILDTLINMGAEPYPLEISSLSESELIYQLNSWKPDFVITVNYVKGLPQICGQLKIPLIVWEIDPTIEVLRKNDLDEKLASGVLIYTYRRSRIAEFKKYGFRHVKYMPLAANPKRYYPMDVPSPLKDKYGAHISFVGSSMYNQSKHLKEKAMELISQHHNIPEGAVELFVEEILAIQRKDFNRFSIPYLLKSKVGNHFTEVAIPDSSGKLINLASCLGESSASERRLEVINGLKYLATKRVVKVWGDEGWRKNIHPSIIYAGQAGHFHELPLIYNATDVNLDINRIYQKDIVPLRVFDVLACRSFIIADNSAETENLFKKNEEIICYRDIRRVPLMCEYYLKNDRERKEIALKGYEKVLKEHTLQRRLSVMLDDLKALRC